MRLSRVLGAGSAATLLITASARADEPGSAAWTVQSRFAVTDSNSISGSGRRIGVSAAWIPWASRKLETSVGLGFDDLRVRRDTEFITASGSSYLVGLEPHPPWRENTDDLRLRQLTVFGGARWYPWRGLFISSSLGVGWVSGTVTSEACPDRSIATVVWEGTLGAGYRATRQRGLEGGVHLGALGRVPPGKCENPADYENLPFGKVRATWGAPYREDRKYALLLYGAHVGYAW